MDDACSYRKKIFGGIRRTDICLIKNEAFPTNQNASGYFATKVAEGHHKPVKKIEIFYNTSGNDSIADSADFDYQYVIVSTSTAPTVKISSLDQNKQEEWPNTYLLDVVQNDTNSENDTVYLAFVETSLFLKKIKINRLDKLQPNLSKKIETNIQLTRVPQLSLSPNAKIDLNDINEKLKAIATNPALTNATLYIVNGDTITVKQRNYQSSSTPATEKFDNSLITASTIDPDTNALFLGMWKTEKHKKGAVATPPVNIIKRSIEAPEKTYKPTLEPIVESTQTDEDPLNPDLTFPTQLSEDQPNADSRTRLNIQSKNLDAVQKDINKLEKRIEHYASAMKKIKIDAIQSSTEVESYLKTNVELINKKTECYANLSLIKSIFHMLENKNESIDYTIEQLNERLIAMHDTLNNIKIQLQNQLETLTKSLK
jgi:hypothetical protein